MANNWTEICAKCMEGDIEPRNCEYYGEPNGCNSPTYGEHPPTSNAAAMLEALKTVKRYLNLCWKLQPRKKMVAIMIIYIKH